MERWKLGIMLKRPALLQDHPNFFFIYFFTMCFHIALALIGIFGKGSNFASPALASVNDFASPRAWGLVSAGIALGMFVGLWRSHFTLSRICLATGATLTATRMCLIALPLLSHHTAQGLSGLPAWGLLTALHLSQTSEPPRNPATSTRGS